MVPVKNDMKRYRLNEYLISCSADGRLWWNSHAGFAMEVGGPCYICGNILVIGTRCTEENGFLVSEFKDYLKKFPIWKITPFYCLSGNLLDAATGSLLSPVKLHRLLSSHHITSSGPVPTGKNETLKLGRYQISISIKGDITWMSFGGIHQIMGGPALVESDVLFLCPKTFDAPNKNKREFQQTLHSLPQWDRTIFWCRTLALKSTNPMKTGPSWSNEYSSSNKQRYTRQLLPVLNSQSEKWLKKLKIVVNRKVKNLRL